MDLMLKGKVALVTGAGSQIGFGRAIALTLAKEGCNIIAADIDQKGAQQTADAVKSLGNLAFAAKADVIRSTEINDMVKEALAKFGTLDILINNAGGASPPKRFVDKPEAEWDYDINLNLRGVLICSKAVLPHMLSRKYGKIINISSGAGRTGQVDRSIYSAAKGAVISFTKVLAREVATSGINVNCILPFVADTNFIRDRSNPQEFLKTFASMVPMGRVATTQDIANAVAFFASDVSSYIQGQTLNVNGGFTME